MKYFLFSLIFCGFFWENSAEQETRSSGPWGFAEGIGLIGAILTKDYGKNPSPSILEDVKSYADSLNNAKGLSDEEKSKVMDNLLGIGDMRLNVSSNLINVLKGKIEAAEKAYRQTLTNQIAILERSNDFPDPVKAWVNEMIIKPLKETGQIFETYLSNRGSKMNRERFQKKLQEEKMRMIGKKFTNLMKEGIGKLESNVYQKKTYDYRHFEGLTNLLQRAQILFMMIAVMHESLNSNGDAEKVNAVINEQNAFRNASEDEKNKWRVSASKLEFLYNAVNLTDAGFKEKADGRRILEKFANNKWKNGSPINYYYLLTYDEKPMTKIFNTYTHMEVINGKIVVLHMRSQLMDEEPKSAPHSWFNWYPAAWRTLEFEIRDELNRIDPMNQTMAELQEIVHHIATIKCSACPTILTSINGPSESYFEGKEPSPAGRLLRIFSKISLFIGY